jgi:hypothetical protein
VNALISASGEHHRHYTAGVFVGVLGVLFGLGAFLEAGVHADGGPRKLSPPP